MTLDLATFILAANLIRKHNQLSPNTDIHKKIPRLTLSRCTTRGGGVAIIISKLLLLADYDMLKIMNKDNEL